MIYFYQDNHFKNSHVITFKEIKKMKKYFGSLLLLSLAASTTLSAELVKTYFKEGELKAETNYIDGTNTPTQVGIKNGVEKVYYQMGQLAYVVNYVNNKRDGKLTWYDKYGRLLADMYYKMGELQGMEKSYYPNGQVKHSVNYIFDKKEGMQKEFYNDGKLALKVNYIHNKKEGMQKEYTEDGRLYSDVFYKNNYKEGNQNWYNAKGAIINTIFYKMDRPVKVMKEVEKANHPVKLDIKGVDFSPQKPR